MLDVNDLTPFAADLTDAQARIVIADIEAELSSIAPSLVTSDDPSVLRICRAAGLRYAKYLANGGQHVKSQQRTRGPFDTRTDLSDANQPVGANLFTPGELENLRSIVDSTAVQLTISLPVGSFPDPPCGFPQ